MSSHGLAYMVGGGGGHTAVAPLSSGSLRSSWQIRAARTSVNNCRSLGRREIIRKFTDGMAFWAKLRGSLAKLRGSLKRSVMASGIDAKKAVCEESGVCNRYRWCFITTAVSDQIIKSKGLTFNSFSTGELVYLNRPNIWVYDLWSYNIFILYVLKVRLVPWLPILL